MQPAEFPRRQGLRRLPFPFSASESRTGSMINCCLRRLHEPGSVLLSGIRDRRFAFSEMPSTSLADPKEAVPVDSSRSSTLETWLVTVDEVIVGIMALHDTDIDQLYLDPQCRGRGIGDLLTRMPSHSVPKAWDCEPFKSTSRPAASTSSTGLSR
jgi:hypothetical protein